MGRFAERVRDLRLRAVSPDGFINAHLASGTRLDVAFTPGSYRRYREAALGEQLSALLSRLFADYRRARLNALSETSMEISGLPAEPLDPRFLDRRDREFHHRREELEARGKSADDTVRVSRLGRTSWTVRIRPDSLPRLEEEGFKRELSSAIAAAQADYREHLGSLRAEIYSEPHATPNDSLHSLQRTSI